MTRSPAPARSVHAKGLLLYGPPGTGKTHTIRYLAANLPGHTTLIITAGQAGLLGAYMNLARLLQPAMVVIEDVDLIASDRSDLGPCEEQGDRRPSSRLASFGKLATAFCQNAAEKLLSTPPIAVANEDRCRMKES